MLGAGVPLPEVGKVPRSRIRVGNCMRCVGQGKTALALIQEVTPQLKVDSMSIARP
jgi:hypothetical protein